MQRVQKGAGGTCIEEAQVAALRLVVLGGSSLTTLNQHPQQRCVEQHLVSLWFCSWPGFAAETGPLRLHDHHVAA
jgi:hypothetical protein